MNSGTQRLSERPTPKLWLRTLEIVLFVLVCGYCLSPYRSLVRDLSVFAGGSLMILLLHRWLLPPALPVGEGRFPHLVLAGLTASITVGLWVWLWLHNPGLVTGRLVGQFVLVSAGYIPFGWLQHYLTQRYLVLRICRPLTGRRDVLTCLLAAGVFSSLHLPFPELLLPTFGGCLVWTWYYLQSGRIWPLAISHGILATSWFICILHRNPFLQIAHIWERF